VSQLCINDQMPQTLLNEAGRRSSSDHRAAEEPPAGAANAEANDPISGSAATFLGGTPMQHRQFWSALGATTLAAALAACAGTATAPNNNETTLGTEMSADAAAGTGQAAISDVDETGNDNSAGSYSTQLAPGLSAATIHALTGGPCTQSGSAGDLRWYCAADTATIMTTGVADTLIRTPNYEFFAAGVAQSTPTSATDSINWGGANGVPVYVAVHRPVWQGVSHRVRNHSVVAVPNFTDSIRTWNGNTVANDTASFHGAVWTVNYTGLAYDTTYNVVFIHPRETHPFPMSGQFRRWATWNYNASGPSSLSGSVSRHIVVTYNGTQTATLQVLGTKTLTCSLDLVYGTLSNCSTS
jgi:hypothetical protein